mmetsp:Transcript_132483/g.255199  ORF Transcript_132483/g.255199 Transcript_132483/m.255199 type:complete len:186 (+) Transcript_132483:127-684(+)
MPAHEIINGKLFLGSAIDARKVDEGDNPFGITHVLNVADYRVLRPGGTQTELVCEWVPMNDDGCDEVFGRMQTEEEYEDELSKDPDARPRGAWHRCRKFLEESFKDADARVLVHCAMGVNRSATIVIAWLMVTKHWGLDKAKQFVKQRRWINPVPDHMEQLKAFEKTLVSAKGNNCHSCHNCLLL